MSKTCLEGTVFGGNIRPLQRVVKKNQQVENRVGSLCRGYLHAKIAEKKALFNEKYLDGKKCYHLYMKNDNKMVTILPSAENHVCGKCDFSCSVKRDWDRHVMTNKHRGKNVTIDGNKNPVRKSHQVLREKYTCAWCQKQYSFRSGLSRHKKDCKKQSNIKIIDAEKNKNIDGLVDLFKDIVKQNLESQRENAKLVKELVKGFQPVNQVINKNHNCNNNISVNVFLNEYCKDAMNIKDFIDNIQLSFEDLTFAKNNGSVKSITDILVRNLKSMEPTERPIHCSDRKRLQFYVKDENKWEKDNEHEKIEDSIASINKKQLDKLHEWLKQNPDWNQDTEKSAMYINMVQQIAWMSEEKQPTQNKVKRNISTVIEIKEAIDQTLEKSNEN